MFVGYRYADELVRDGDRWRIKDRQYTRVFTSHGPCMNEDVYTKASGQWRIARRTIRPLMPAQMDAY